MGHRGLVDAVPDGHGDVMRNVVLTYKFHEVGGVSKALFDVKFLRQKARRRVVPFEPVLPEVNLGVMDIAGVYLKRSVSEGNGGHIVGFVEFSRE